MSNTPITTNIIINGLSQTCLLKEKSNNGNGQMLFRYVNQHSGNEYLLVKEGNDWRTLNETISSTEIFQQLCEFSDNL